MKPSWTLLLAGLLLALLVPAAPAAQRTCPGTVAFSGKRIVVVTLRGTTCTAAKRVVRAYAKGVPPRPWACALAHAPFDRVHGRIVGFSCGHGGGPGDLRARPHAFLGTIAKG